MKPSVLILMLFSFYLFIIIPTAQSQQCLTAADQPPCDQSVSLTELTTHINSWYMCSACVPDIFQSLQAYFGKPFCGDYSCNATVGEDCASCEHDCGNCTGPEPNATIPQDYIAYWKFESSTDDEKGANNGTWMGDDEVYVDGQVGMALEFDGDGDYVDLGDMDILEGMSLLTMSFWINLKNLTSYQNVLSKGCSSSKV